MTTAAPVVHLHIGPMKSGTSYLQQLMADHQGALASGGVLFPGGDEPRKAQVRAVRAMLRSGGPAGPPAWRQLRREALDYQGSTSVISMEFLSFCGRLQAKEIVSSLAPAEVHVVLTVRDASRVLPSAWATSTRNRQTRSWPDYAAALLAGRDADRRQYRRSVRALNVPRMLRVWGRLLPPERLHVVTVPPSGSEPALLWRRFAAALGVDHAVLVPPPARRNTAFGYASADLMRQVNARVTRLSHAEYARVTRPLCFGVLDRRGAEPPIPMTPQINAFCEQWNDMVREHVRSSGARLEGDLDDLQARPGTTVDQIEDVDAAHVLAAAQDAGEALARWAGVPLPDTLRGDAVGTEVEPAIHAVADLFRKVARVPPPGRVSGS